MNFISLREELFLSSSHLCCGYATSLNWMGMGHLPYRESSSSRYFEFCYITKFDKVEKWKTTKTNWFNQNEWPKICAIFLRDGVKEMMRNEICFVVLFLVKMSYIFPKSQVSQTPCLYNSFSLIWASKYPTIHTNACKMINSMTRLTQKWSQVVWNRTCLDNHLI